MEESINKLKISLMINYIIVVITVIGVILSYINYNFMPGVPLLLAPVGVGIFRLFTVLSNILAGIASFILARYERKYLIGKIDIIPTKCYLFKYISAVSVGLTFVVVFTYLIRIVPDGMITMLSNYNLFFHLIIPILSILSFILLEKNSQLKFKHIFYGLIPMVLYAVYYITNLLLHLENGQVDPKYDWYWFVQGGMKQAFIVVPGIIMITMAISISLYYLNKKRNN